MIALWIAWQVTAAMPLLEQGRFADARGPLEKACVSGEPNGCYLLGRTLLTLDQYDAALRVLRPLLQTDPDRWRVHDALGSVYEAQRQPAEAERHYRAAVEGNGGRTPEPVYHLGRFLVREGRTAEAIGVLAPAAGRFGRYEWIRFELGRAYYQTNRLLEAEAELQSAPSLEEARRLLGKVRRQRGK
jgi:Flp pilus assembly protein TadD